MNRLLLSLTLTACSSFATAQTTWTVGPGASLSAVFAQTQPGDTVLVLPGSYAASFVIDKGIQVIGLGAQLTPPVFAGGEARIENVPAGQTCVFAGFSVDDTGASAGDVSLRIADCAGRVVLRELKQSGLMIWFVSVEDSAQVRVAESVVRTLAIADSDVVCEHVVFDAGFAPGLSVAGGRTTVVASTVTGGALFGSVAIFLQAGELAITRSSVSSIAQNAPAIATSGGALVLDPSTTLSSSGGSLITGTASVVTSNVYSLATRFDAVGGAMQLENHGIADELFVTVMSLPTAAAATPLGTAWVDATSIVAVTAATYGQTRLHQATLPLPPLPPGLSVALQSVVFSAAGLTLSTPSLLAVDG